MVRDPMQRCGHFVPGLRSQPWWDATAFPVAQALTAAADDITAEFEDFVLSGSLRLHPQSHGGPRTPLTTGNWNIVDLWAGGQRNAHNAMHAPVTMRILMSEPAVVSSQAGLAYFSILAPGAHVSAHCGPTNARLRIHLGLHVPPDSRIRVGRQARRWQSGRCLIFDDSWEHEVWNDSARPRSVLIVDIAHPDLPQRTGKGSQPGQVPSTRRREGGGERAGWLPRQPSARRRPAAECLDETLLAVGTSRAAAIRDAACRAAAQRFAQPKPVPQPWSWLTPQLAELGQHDALDLVQASAILWRSHPGQDTAAQAVLRRWPPASQAGLLGRLARLPDVATRAEFLAAYERQPGAPPFGATVPMLVSATRAAWRAAAARR